MEMTSIQLREYFEYHSYSQKGSTHDLAKLILADKRINWNLSYARVTYIS